MFQSVGPQAVLNDRGNELWGQDLIQHQEGHAARVALPKQHIHINSNHVGYQTFFEKKFHVLHSLYLPLIQDDNNSGDSL